MDADRCDDVLRPWGSSRRPVLGAGLGALLGLAGLTPSDAKKKRKKKKKKKDDGGSSRPVARADAACAADGAAVANARLAQTFRAQQSGQLISASVVLTSNIAGADFDLEIWSVDAANVPSTVLAGTTIVDVPATDAETGERTLTGTFPTPATVVAGLRFALVITGPANQGYYLRMSLDNPCADGSLFSAPSPGAAFTESPTRDLAFATVVSA